MLEAAQRVRNGRPAVERNGDPARSLVMSLCISEVVQAKREDGFRLYRLQKMSKGDYVFRALEGASINDKRTEIRVASMKRARELELKKVRVSVLGEMQPRL